MRRWSGQTILSLVSKWYLDAQNVVKESKLRCSRGWRRPVHPKSAKNLESQASHSPAADVVHCSLNGWTSTAPVSEVGLPKQVDQFCEQPREACMLRQDRKRPLSIAPTDVWVLLLAEVAVAVQVLAGRNGAAIIFQPRKSPGKSQRQIVAFIMVWEGGLKNLLACAGYCRFARSSQRRSHAFPAEKEPSEGSSCRIL